MKRLVIGTLIAAAATVGAILFFRGGSEGQPHVSPSIQAPAEISSTFKTNSTPSLRVQDSANGAAKPAPLAGRAELLNASRDYYEYAASLIDAARAGDDEAQYFLSVALKYCDDGYKAYFDRGNHRRTLDEAVQWSSTRPATSVEELREVYERCVRLKDKERPAPFGTPDEWLEQSAHAGYALASVDKAVSMALAAGDSGKSADVEARNEAKKLAREAVRSKDPAVLWKLSELALLFADDSTKAEEEQWVWRVAACQRGFDCSANAEWYKVGCRLDPNCQPYDTGLDFIRRLNSANFDEIEQRAKELNEKLDANKFDELKM